MMTPERFAALGREGYNRVPVYREVLADLDTPLSTYLKLAGAPYSYLLESVQGGEKWGRYSIIGLPSRTRIRVHGHHVRLERDRQVLESVETPDPLAWIAAYRNRYRAPDLPELPRFTGGLVGYFGYDTVRYIEPRLGESTRPDPLGLPDILLMESEKVLVFDNLKGKLFLVVHADATRPDAWERAQGRLDELVDGLRTRTTPYAPAAPSGRVAETDFVSGFTRAGFEAAVERIERYIVDGDCMQVVLSQRLSVPYRADPLDLYRALRSLNPSPYMFFLNLGEFHIVGSSPEILVRLEGDTVTVRPIAGTRPRGATDEEDRRLERELLADPKELAEHLMLIDLGRNDVGRVSEPGTVEVGDRFVIERYSHVMHIVSEVTGRLKEGLNYADVLRATFPAGTVSGAPKIRALEVIRELEPIKRNIYAGSIGYIGWSGDTDMAIAIRTAVIQDGRLHVQAGAGIVHDSDPATEWAETMNKGRALFRAVEEAARGL